MVGRATLGAERVKTNNFLEDSSAAKMLFFSLFLRLRAAGVLLSVRFLLC